MQTAADPGSPRDRRESVAFVPRTAPRTTSAPPAFVHRRLILLGSTGSIGRNTLEVVAHLNRLCCVPDHGGRADSSSTRRSPNTSGRCFSIVGLAAGRNVDLLAEQAIRYRVPFLAILDPEAGERLRDRLAGGYPAERIADRPDLGPTFGDHPRLIGPGGTPHIFTGPDAARQLVDAVDSADLLVGAITGAAGLPATLAAIERGMDVALANKETLVAAGELVIPAARRRRVAILPVDSEHSALFQCLQAVDHRAACVGSSVGLQVDRPTDGSLSSRGTSSPEHRYAAHGDPDTVATADTPPPHPTPAPGLDQVVRLVLTASGGPFRTWTRQAIANATVEQALNHPTWNMGAKVTIDSASLTNKALELLEARHLFDLGPEALEVVVHPQSIVHGLIEFRDGSVLAQMGPPDMRAPIQYALTYPDRLPGCSPRMDWRQAMQLTFEPPDEDRFPALRLVREVMARGGVAGAVFNAANEVAVEAFLARRIAFGRIAELAESALRAVADAPLTHLDEALAADAEARAIVTSLLGAD